MKRRIDANESPIQTDLCHKAPCIMYKSVNEHNMMKQLKITKLKDQKGFYSDPYLTCFFCNHIIFLDIHQFRFLQTIRSHGVITTDFIPKSLQNHLPPCEKCNKLDGFVFGAHDFSTDIEQLKRLKALRVKRERNAVCCIVRFYRHYLQRKYRKAVAGAKLTRHYLRSKAATCIASLGRGRLARRRYATEKHLAFIKESHPLLISRAIQIVPGQPRLFWYHRSVELKLVYKNYLEFIEKTGHQPVRAVVERNIAQLRQRIFQRQEQLGTIIQSQWRGFMVRRIVQIFRTEVSRLFCRDVSRVLKIQRVFRGHVVRMFILPKLLHDRLNNAIMKSYQVETYRKKLNNLRQRAKEGLQVAYLKEQKLAKTAKFTSKLPYQFDSQALPPSIRRLASMEECRKQSSVGNGDESKFYLSLYGDAITHARSSKVLLADNRLTMLKFKAEEHDTERRNFIINRIAERGPSGYGSRDQLPSLTETMFSRPPATIVGQQRSRSESSRSHAMRQYFSDDLEQIKSNALQRVLQPSEEDCVHAKQRHDKKRASTHQQLQRFNQGKFLAPTTSKGEGMEKEGKKTRMRSHFQCPAHLSFDAKEWLYANDDEVC
jgi:hypothetical protein